MNDKLGMAEVFFRVACITDGKLFKMYSRAGHPETTLATEFDVTYYHGRFDLSTELGLEEAIYSIELRCQELDLKFTKGYARRLITEYTF